MPLIKKPKLDVSPSKNLFNKLLNSIAPQVSSSDLDSESVQPRRKKLSHFKDLPKLDTEPLKEYKLFKREYHQGDRMRLR